MIHTKYFGPFQQDKYMTFASAEGDIQMEDTSGVIQKTGEHRSIAKL